MRTRKMKLKYLAPAYELKAYLTNKSRLPVTGSYRKAPKTLEGRKSVLWKVKSNKKQMKKFLNLYRILL